MGYVEGQFLQSRPEQNRCARAWRVATCEKYHHSVELLAVSGQDGKFGVTGRVSGNFQGNPIPLELEGGKIISLEIR